MYGSVSTLANYKHLSLIPMDAARPSVVTPLGAGISFSGGDEVTLMCFQLQKASYMNAIQVKLDATKRAKVSSKGMSTVISYLAGRAIRQNGQAVQLGINRIARETHHSERQVTRILNALEAGRFIERDQRRRPDGGDGVYEFLVLPDLVDALDLDPVTGEWQRFNWTGKGAVKQLAAMVERVYGKAPSQATPPDTVSPTPLETATPPDTVSPPPPDMVSPLLKSKEGRRKEPSSLLSASSLLSSGIKSPRAEQSSARVTQPGTDGRGLATVTNSSSNSTSGRESLARKVEDAPTIPPDLPASPRQMGMPDAAQARAYHPRRASELRSLYYLPALHRFHGAPA